MKPTCLQALYNLSIVKATQSSNKLAVTAFLDQFTDGADLKVPTRINFMC